MVSQYPPSSKKLVPSSGYRRNCKRAAENNQILEVLPQNLRLSSVLSWAKIVGVLRVARRWQLGNLRRHVSFLGAFQ